MRASKKGRLSFGRLSATRAKAFGPLDVRFLLNAPKSSPFSALVVSMKPGASHPPIQHDKTWEFFLILRGSNRARIGGRERVLKRGDYAYMPPGVSHAFHAGPRGVEVLVIFAPAMDFLKPDIVGAGR